MTSKIDLVREDDEVFGELRAAVAGLSEEQMTRPGYYEAPGWSVKDLLAHLACWLAEGVQELEQIREGTYRPVAQDVDAMNRRFYEACRDLELREVWAQLHAARARLQEELDAARDPLDELAVRRFRVNGPEHYRDHLPRLREWTRDLARPVDR